MKKTLIALSLLAVCSAPAIAHDMRSDDDMDGKDKMGMMMQMKTDYYLNKMDSNKDGYVSRAEHKTFADNMFKDADTNNDGKISGQELMDAKWKEHDDMKMAMGDKMPKPPKPMRDAPMHDRN